jgi:hypothetical protein
LRSLQSDPSCGKIEEDFAARFPRIHSGTRLLARSFIVLTQVNLRVSRWLHQGGIGPKLDIQYPDPSQILLFLTSMA